MNTGFSTQQISRMLGVSPARLRAYVRAGLLCPQRGQAGELRFSFQDLLLLRTAEGLVTDRLPPRRVRDALLKLRRRLPTERPLTGLSLETDGEHVVVRDGRMAWRADSGQGLLSFGDAPAVPTSEGGSRDRSIARLRPRPAPGEASYRPDVDPERHPPSNVAGTITPPTAEQFYLLGCTLEDDAPGPARVAYLNALRLNPEHPDTHVNLGRLLHEAGDLEGAEEHYRRALSLRPDDATAAFNLGVVLEDRAAPEDAVAAYEAALRIEPSHADAHFNAARLHDLAGRYEAALRHLREYRNLVEST